MAQTNPSRTDNISPAFGRMAAVLAPVIVAVALIASTGGALRAQTGEVVSGSGALMVEEGDEGNEENKENEDYKDYKEIEENKENKDYNEANQDEPAAVTSSLSSLISLSFFDSSSSDEQNQTDTGSGSTSSAALSLNQDESSAATSSIATDQTDSGSGSISSVASSVSQDESSAVTSSLSSLSSLSSFALSLPSLHLVTDAPLSQNTPVLAIAKSGDIQAISDIVGSIDVTLTGFNKTLVTDLRMEETDGEILVFVETHAVFRPGDYDLIVTWTASRTDLRLMEKLFDVVSGGEETVLLEERITLGSVSLETERVQTIASAEGDLAVTRTSVVRTNPGAEETMTIVVTPKATFVGSITEKVPAGFKVESVTPFGEITETEDGTVISWNREFAGAVPLTLSYTFTTSPVAPLYAQFGPLEAKGSVTGRVSEEDVIDGEMQEATEATDDSEGTEELEATEESSSVSSIAQNQIETASGSTSSTASSVSQDESSAVTSSSVASVASESSSATEAELSWFRLFLAELLQGEPFRFTETHRWAMLVEPSEDTRVSRIGGAMLLEPLNGGVFDANAMPSFTLVETLLSGTGAETIDAKGRFIEEKALTSLVHALTDEKTIKETALESLLEGRKEDIADAIINDSVAMNILLDGTVPKSAKRAAAAKAEDALKSEEKKKEASVILSEDREVQAALDALVTIEMEQDIVEQSIRESLGKKSETTQDLLTDAAGKIAVESVSDTVVDAIHNVDNTKQKLAEVMMQDDKENKEDKENKGVPIIQVRLTNRNGETVLPKFHFVPGSVVLVLEPERAFTPGLYQVEVSVFNPLTQETVVQTADFAWGVLAMNPAQDRYRAGDVVQLAIGVLDDGGRIVCDSDLKLEVRRKEAKDYSKEAKEAKESVHVITLTTEDGSIETGSSCGVKEAGLIDPDYSTSFTAVEAGLYELTLTATTANGTRSMTSTIEVSEPPFLIRRIGATRLWPLAPSPMHITITFNQSVTGTITETLPEGFEVSDIRPAATVRKEDDGSVTLQWKGSWNEGEQTTFRYLYDAPDISPQFYLLGPLKVSSALPFLPTP